MSAIRHHGICPGPSPTCGTSFRILCTLFVLCLPTPGWAEGIRWRTDYAKAVKEAGEKGAPILLNIGTESCYWCKQLEARTLIDEEIVKLLDDRIIPLKIDGNKHNYLVEALKVQSYPTLVFASHDGSILGYKEGFVEAAPLKEQLVKVLASVGTPDWMQRDHDAGMKAISAGDFPKGITLLRNVVEDGKTRPVQVRARKYLAEIEKQASEKLAKVREHLDKGENAEAITGLEFIGKHYVGTLACRRGKQLQEEILARSDAGANERKKQAAELLKQANEDYKGRQYLCCLDRCELLTGKYRDLPEAASAEKLASEIKDNPEWTKQACDQLGDRMCLLYLSMADSWLRKGQPQQAVFYLDRVVKMFPGTKHAEDAQGRLARIKGAPSK